MAGQRVAFGTSGHRGSSLTVLQRGPHRGHDGGDRALPPGAGDAGPLFMGRDTHALSEPAFKTALEVLARRRRRRARRPPDGYTPTPAVSHAILRWNREHPDALADGIVVTPSHNPPADGGFKYDPPTGGPADSATTRAIEDAANALLRDGIDEVARSSAERARADACGTTSSAATSPTSPTVIDMPRSRDSGLRIGVDPLGGASIAYWARDRGSPRRAARSSRTSRSIRASVS